MALWDFSKLATAMWLDFSDASTMYDATSGGSLVAADGAIARLEDKSGNGRHAKQSTEGSRPTRKSSVFDGKDSVLFDGTNDGLALDADLILGTAYTIFAIAKPASTIGSATASQAILHGGSYTYPNTDESILLLYFGSTTGGLTNERLSWLAVAHGATQTGVYGYGQTTSDISNAVVCSLAYRTSDNSVVKRINGRNDFGSNTISGAFSSINTRYPTKLRRFGSSVSSSYLDGHLLEVAVVASYLTSDEINIAEGYLHHKYGLESLLPADHPYKSAAPTTGSSLLLTRRRWAARR